MKCFIIIVEKMYSQQDRLKLKAYYDYFIAAREIQGKYSLKGHNGFFHRQLRLLGPATFLPFLLLSRGLFLPGFLLRRHELRLIKSQNKEIYF